MFKDNCRLIMKTLLCAVMLRISISVAIVGKSMGETGSSLPEARDRYSFVCFVSIAKVQCTGSILTASVVATASHCKSIQKEEGKGDNYVIAGKQEFLLSSVDSDEQIQKRKIKNLIPYSKHFAIFKHDIMLLKLEKDFELNSYVSTIHVMNRATYPKAQRDLCQMLSFREDQSTVSLNASVVLAEHPDHCLVWTEEHRQSTLCSRLWEPPEVCGGHSGAPLVCQDVLTGLFKSAIVDDASSATCNVHMGFHGFLSFTYVGYYVPWIHVEVDGVKEGVFTLIETEDGNSGAAALGTLYALLVFSLLSSTH